MLQSIVDYIQGQNAQLLVLVFVFAARCLRSGDRLLPAAGPSDAERDQGGTRQGRHRRRALDAGPGRDQAHRRQEADRRVFQGRRTREERPDALELKLFRQGSTGDNAVPSTMSSGWLIVGLAFIIVYMVAGSVAPPRIPGAMVALGSGVVALAFMAFPALRSTISPGGSRRSTGAAFRTSWT